MANVTERRLKDGSLSYRVRVSAGYDGSGRQIFKSMTYVPNAGLTERQIQKELARRVADFEKQVEAGVLIDPKMTVDALLEKFFAEYALQQLKPATVYGYRKLVPRVSAALGHNKLNQLRPGHLMTFYNNLREEGVRQDGKYCATQVLVARCGKGTRRELVEKSGVSERTIARTVNGGHCGKKTAVALAEATGVRR